MASRSPTLDLVRGAVRSVVQSTPELATRPALRRRLAENMVGVSMAAAELIDAERRFEAAVRRPPERAPARAPASSTALARAPLAAGQAAGDIHRMTAVRSAADVLQATRRALDFPGFVTSLITGVFQAMTTSSIQQLEAYANLLEAVNTSTDAFAASSISPGRAASWAVSQFPQLQVTEDDPPSLAIRDEAEMPSAAALKTALGATDAEVSEIDESDLESTLIPLVSRKLAQDRQQMLSTMVLMGMNRIVVDEGRISASMELQVDARSTAEQMQAERFDSRFTTSASGSFGMGAWGASASMSATVGYVRSDEQFTREDIALRAGLRSHVDIAFHTEPVSLDRMASEDRRRSLRSRAMVPEAEERHASLLAEGGDSPIGSDPRRTSRPTFEPVPAAAAPTAPAVGSEEWERTRARRDYTPREEGSGGGSSGSGSRSSAGGGSSGSGSSGSGSSRGGSSGSGSSGSGSSGGGSSRTGSSGSGSSGSGSSGGSSGSGSSGGGSGGSSGSSSGSGSSGSGSSGSGSSGSGSSGSGSSGSGSGGSSGSGSSGGASGGSSSGGSSGGTHT